ncbi:MAG: tetratricopeptide repeat protein, partial [Planctomycetota bacterium]
ALYYQGRYDEAESIFKKVIEIRKRIFGKDHLETISTLGNLALIFTAQGKYSETEPIQREVLEARRNLLGEEHPDTWNAWRELAVTLLNQEKYSEAESISRTVLEARIRHFGEKHPETLRSMHDLALVSSYQGKDSEAMQLYHKALLIARESLPPSHQLTAYFVLSYGNSLMKAARYSEAEEYLLEAYKLFASAVGEKDRRINYPVSNLVELYQKWDQPEKAAEWEAKLVE